MYFCNFLGTAEVESTSENQNQKPQYNLDTEERGSVAMKGSYPSSLKACDETDKGKTSKLPEKEASNLEQIKATSQADTSRSVAELRHTDLRATRDVSRSIDRSQIIATRTSLDHTITVSIISV